ncbi:MAG: hypothetical protein FWG54_05375 [Bacteroidetes bacterium]|nr:hypothetical protein [Bacteroidota bacterium]
MKHIFSLPLLCTLLVCCTTMDQMEPIPYKVFKYEVADFSSFSKLELNDMTLSDYDYLFFFLDKSITFCMAAIEYTTIDPFGNPIQASGLVYHPLNRQSKGVIEVMPMAHLETNGPSEDFLAVEGLPIFQGYTVIIPDLLGFGVSRGTRPPFLMRENTGRVTYDMRRAAAQYLWDQFQYQLPSETIIGGYSLGGSAALAVQKYYETYHSNSVKIKEVFAGGGAFDLPAAFEAFAKTGYSNFSAIPHTIFAFDYYYNLHLDFSQIFVADPPLNSDSWFNGVYSTDKIEKLGEDIHGYMHPDFFKPFDQQNEEMKKLHPCLVLNSVSEGWKPKAPIHIYHCYTDTYVPYECAQALVTKLRKVGGNVSFTSYLGDHLTVGYTFILRMLLYLS